MTQQKPRAKLTVDDYMNTPDDVRYQLIDGELILAPSPSFRHQVILGLLFAELNRFSLLHDLGIVCVAPLDVVFPDREVYQPDILFVSNERREIITEANIQGAPDLVVEILSPSTQQYDRGHKREVYAERGVREYWIVDPGAGTVEVLSAADGDWEAEVTFSREDALVSRLLPGLSIELGPVFEVAK